MPNTENGRVTLAVAVSEIKNLRTVVETGFSDAKEERAEIKEVMSDQDERVRELETKATKNEEQHKWLWGGQIGTVIGTIGGLFGLPKS